MRQMTVNMLHQIVAGRKFTLLMKLKNMIWRETVRNRMNTIP